MATKVKTEKMREKETAEDYRFIPDPDLPSVKIQEALIAKLKSTIPETPIQKLDRLIKKHKIDKTSATILTQNLELVEFFEAVSNSISASFALPWVTGELLRVLHYNSKSLSDPEIEISAEHFSELLQAVQQKKITELKAKQILNDFVPKSFSIKSKIKKEAIISEKDIEKIVDLVLKNNEKAVSDYQSGEKSALNFLIGQIMKKSDKKADYKTLRIILEKKLKK